MVTLRQDTKRAAKRRSVTSFSYAVGKEKVMDLHDSKGNLIQMLRKNFLLIGVTKYWSRLSIKVTVPFTTGNFQEQIRPKLPI